MVAIREPAGWQATCHTCGWVFRDPDSMIVLYAAQIHRDMYQTRHGVVMDPDGPTKGEDDA